MSNPGVAFDKNLLQSPGEANASLAGVPLRLNPTSVSLPYNLRVNKVQTIGGMVVQLYGVEWGDLTVQGQFGAGGWQEQAAFFQFIKSLTLGTAGAQLQQVFPDQSQVNPDGAVRFIFPLLNYDFMVFIKAYTSLEGMAVELYNENINPTWQLVMTIDNDLSGLTQTATDQFVARLGQGLGYSTNKGYNGPTGSSDAAGDLQTYLSNYAQGQSLLQSFQQAYGTGVNTGSSSTISPTAELQGNGNAQQGFNYFIQQGFSKIQAAAIIGNFMQESSMDPSSVQSGGPGRGIAQWGVGGRWDTLVAYAHQNKVQPTALATQLAFVMVELNGDYAKVQSDLLAATDIASATTIFCNEYEAPGVPDLQNRIQYAQSALTAYG